MFQELPVELQSLIFSSSIDLLYNALFINKSIHKLIYNIYLLSIPITQKEIDDYIDTNPEHFMVINNKYPKQIIYQHYEYIENNKYKVDNHRDTVYLFNPPHKIYLMDEDKHYCYTYGSSESEIIISDDINSFNLDVISLYNIYIKRNSNIRELVKYKLLSVFNTDNVVNNIDFIKYYYTIVNNLLLFGLNFEYVKYNEMTTKNIDIAKAQINELTKFLKLHLTKLS